MLVIKFMRLLDTPKSSEKSRPRSRILRSQLQKNLSIFPIFILVFGFLLFLAPKAEARSPLQFKVDNQTFAYNLEWTGIDSIVEGETFIGNILKTFFEYHFNKRLYVQGGALLQHPFGDDDRIDEVDPIIALHYRAFPGWKVTAGTIDRNHPLHDGIFWEALRFIDPIEQGFQLKGDTEFVKQDLWIAWERRETANTRERFSVGNVTELRWNGFSLDGQLLWAHLGGQQNTGPGVFNNLSIAFGGGYTLIPDIEGFSFFKEAGFRVHYLYQEDEPAGLIKLDERGVAVRAWVNLWGVNLVGRFWNADGGNFNSRRGDLGQPGIALAKGNPLYRAEEFQEVGIYKVFQLAESVSMRFDLRQQWVLDESVEVYAVTFQWVDGFDLFENYFRKRGQGRSDKTVRRSKPRTRLKRRVRATYPDVD